MFCFIKCYCSYYSVSLILLLSLFYLFFLSFSISFYLFLSIYIYIYFFFLIYLSFCACVVRSVINRVVRGKSGTQGCWRQRDRTHTHTLRDQTCCNTVPTSQRPPFKPAFVLVCAVKLIQLLPPSCNHAMTPQNLLSDIKHLQEPNSHLCPKPNNICRIDAMCRC